MLTYTVLSTSSIAWRPGAPRWPGSAAAQSNVWLSSNRRLLATEQILGCERLIPPRKEAYCANGTPEFPFAGLYDGNHFSDCFAVPGNDYLFACGDSIQDLR